MATPIIMPKQGNSVEECLLSKWRIKEGDQVALGDIIGDIETDKAVFELEANAAGIVLALFWEEGDLVPVLTNICVIGEAGEDVDPFRPEADTEGGSAVLEEASTIEKGDDENAAPSAQQMSEPLPAAHLSPRARKFMAKHPFNLPSTLRGTGAGGRIIERDVIEAFRQAPRLSSTAEPMQANGIAAPAVGTGVGGMIRAADMGKEVTAGGTTVTEDVIEEIKFSNIRRIIAARLHDSLASTAQYTLNAEADVTGLLALRKQIKEHGRVLGLPNITLGDMVMFALIKALEKHPEINAEFADNVIRRHSAVHLGFACDTERGLMVPVIHNVQTMSLPQMAFRVRELAKQANSGALNPDLLAGGTFTVSNLGAFGISNFTPVINTPQVGVLGVGTTILRAVRQADKVVYRDFMQFSLTLNHMVVDGAPGARFLQTLTELIENFGQVDITAQSS